MRRIVMFGVVSMLAVSATSCSMLGGSSDQPSATPQSTIDPPAASAPATSGGPSATGSPTSAGTGAPTPADPSQSGTAADQLGTPVATRTSAIGGKKVVMTMYPVLRDGTTSHVNLAFTAVTAGDRVGLAQALSDGSSTTSDISPFAADGIQLVDGKNKKLYLVASDGDGHCLCSRNLTVVTAVKDAPVLISATFAAPPADVSAVDVRVPQFGTVKSVPVS